MRVLAKSYTPEELNKHGFGLYAEFRPDVSGWGAKGEVRCAMILEQRKKTTKAEEKADAKTSEKEGEAQQTGAFVKYETGGGGDDPQPPIADVADEPSSKKLKTDDEGLSLEEYEAMLDADNTFADIDLTFSESSNAQIGQGT